MVDRLPGFVSGVLLDAVLGDPPNAAHPVVLIGRAAALARRCAPTNDASRRKYGVAIATAIPVTAAVAAGLIERRWPAWLGGRTAAGAALLALACSRRSLFARAIEIADALDAGELAEARRLLGYHLVSRDTGDLTAAEVAGATIESVAENLHDGVLAPWLAFALGGSAGAWAYRAANTMDALWGYHEPVLEELGMGAARLDDALNYLPARLGAATICAAALLRDGDAEGAWRAWLRDGTRTPSPNAGAPMAAMAGALGVVLDKRGAYVLNGGGRAANAADIRSACAIADAGAGLVAVAVTAILAVRR